jgi:hAT family C-terminal dimerisation region
MDDLEEADELNDYLAKPLEKVRNPLGWWWDHRTSYPTLSKMAFDFLSIPHELIGTHLSSKSTVSNVILATSTAVERVFSRGRHLLPFTQSHLSGASICALLCFGDWSRKDLIATSDVVEAIKYSHGNRKRKRALSETASIESN